ncbi:MAG: lysine--tRNA ligase [Candidatus Omnitrophica bacterium]|nr:lysine--tRNA ligase [Candidatus Omnitrophota bacterium]
MENLNEIIRQRINKLKEIKEKNIDPYGRKFERSHSINEAVNSFDETKEVIVKTAGRIRALRGHGKSSFLDIRDEDGKIQLYVKKGLISEDEYWLFERLDIGDIIGIEGRLFKTRSGEVTIEVKSLTLLSKSLRPLPEKWHGLKDVEARYRQRYLDLISNEEVRKTFKLRTRIVSKIKEFLDKKGYLEVETPMMHIVPGGAAGRPFKTHHNVYDIDLYLRIAPELYLKKLLVGGFEKIYEINRSFRNEGISVKHNPEFTMLEVYQAYGDYEEMMDLIEELVTYVAQEVLGTLKITYQGEEIDLKRPWKRQSFAEALGISPEEKDPAAWKKILCAKFGLDINEKISRSALLNVAEDLLDEKEKNNPTFFTDYFTEVSPLAKTRKDRPLLAERFELFVGGMEIANAYSELNDPLEQAERIRVQQEDDEERLHKIDKDFITALEYGMPPAGGLGIGIDRLVMLLADKASIREVILFPQLKPEKQD